MSASDVGIADKEDATGIVYTIGAQGAKGGVAIAAAAVSARGEAGELQLTIPTPGMVILRTCSWRGWSRK